MYVCVCVCVYVCVCVCMYVCMSVCMYVCVTKLCVKDVVCESDVSATSVQTSFFLLALQCHLPGMRHHCGPGMGGMRCAMIFCAPCDATRCST